VGRLKKAFRFPVWRSSVWRSETEALCLVDESQVDCEAKVHSCEELYVALWCLYLAHVPQMGALYRYEF
jgi:hypothetical protein